MPANVTPFSIKLPCALRLQKTFLNLSTGISTPGTFSWSSARMKKFDTCTEENKSMSFQMGARLNYRLFNFALEKIGVRFFVDLSHDNGLFEQNGVSDGGDYQYDVYSLMKAAVKTTLMVGMHVILNRTRPNQLARVGSNGSRNNTTRGKRLGIRSNDFASIHPSRTGRLTKMETATFMRFEDGEEEDICADHYPLDRATVLNERQKQQQFALIEQVRNHCSARGDGKSRPLVLAVVGAVGCNLAIIIFVPNFMCGKCLQNVFFVLRGFNAIGYQVRLFHMPKFCGLLKSALHERTNEIVLLQYMKFFVYYDTVLIRSVFRMPKFCGLLKSALPEPTH
ncbi:hypothetical protein niasHS_009116 [Heterodera schachtii]|uniref:Uncharacterized protein n=1 Tax=Heterodera schachtii TaxID=97005 RepID=A0ABD2JE48_HETSC